MKLTTNLTYKQTTQDSATHFHEYYEIVNEHGKVIAITGGASKEHKDMAKLFAKVPEMLETLDKLGSTFSFVGQPAHDYFKLVEKLIAEIKGVNHEKSMETQKQI